MKDRDKFISTFDKLHASPDVLTEVLNMTTDNKIVSIRGKSVMRKAFVIAATLVLIIGMCSFAYAADIGGIQRTVQVWIHGDQTEAIFTAENGQYTLEYTDEDGNKRERSGGGVALESGKERPLTAEELQEQLNVPEVEYWDDGTVYLTYLNQKMDITDMFKDGYCFVTLDENGTTQYVTVKYNNGLAMSPHGYVQPDEFN